MSTINELRNFAGHARGPDRRLHEITWQGKFLKWKVHEHASKCRIGAVRGDVLGFSKQSRLRLLAFMNTIRWNDVIPCRFITLTYRDDCTEIDSYGTSKHRSSFWRSLEEHQGHQIPAVWRIEWMPRQSGTRKGQAMPHFHILAFKEDYIDWRFVRRTWSNIHGGGYIRTEVARARSEREAAGYVAKYCAKQSSPSLVIDAYHNRIPPGRQWGVLRKPLIPVYDRKRIYLPDNDSTSAARQYAHDGREAINKYGNESFTLLGKMAEDIGQFIFGNTIDD